MDRNFFLAACYKKGLSGQKPIVGLLLNGEEFAAQMRGYEQYLANQDLADRLQTEFPDSSSSRGSGESHWSPEPTKSKPMFVGNRRAYRIVATGLVSLDFIIAWFIVTHPNPFPRMAYHPFTMAVLPFFLGIFFIFPGLIFLLPAAILWETGGKEKEYRT
jgi:hypothetical protein